MSRQYLTYHSVEEMPPHVRRSCAMMRNAWNSDFKSHLAEIFLRPECLKKAVVMVVDNEIVGWYAVFNYYDEWANEFRPEFGYWVKKRHRGKGYGKAIIAHSMKYTRCKAEKHCWVPNIMACIRANLNKISLTDIIYGNPSPSSI